MILKGFDDDQKKALQRQAKKDKDVVLFRTNPLENLMDPETEKQRRNKKNEWMKALENFATMRV